MGFEIRRPKSEKIRKQPVSVYEDKSKLLGIELRVREKDQGETGSVRNGSAFYIKNIIPAPDFVVFECAAPKFISGRPFSLDINYDRRSPASA